ncbi:MAG TPA: phospholipase D-like domain-containing protein [Myxococcota bacterium]
MTDALRALLDPRVPPGRVARAWRTTLDRLMPLGGASDGNQITPFFDGDDAYEAMLAAIHAAKTRVWLETYILAPDRAGRLFLAALLAARQRGVAVIVIFDVVGSNTLRSEHILPLIKAGVRVVPFNPPRPVLGRLSVFLRDHRKILIVDDDVAFCGGMNISEDYAGFRHGNGRFRDTHALVEGPAVADLAAVFAGSVATTTREQLEPPAPVAPLASGVFAQVLGSNVLRRRRHIQRALFTTVGRSVTHCYLTTPYFVPPPRLLRALIRAAKRGVDVRIVTAGVSDVPIVAIAARHLYGSLLRAGVRIFEMTKHTLHAKTASIDGVYASVGSFNLDRWSFTRNLEVNLTVVDAGLASELTRQFSIDEALSREIHAAEYSLRSVLVRAIGWLAYQLVRR